MRALTLALLAGGLLGTALSCGVPSGPRAPSGATRDRAALRGLGAVALAVEPPALEPLCRKLLLAGRGPALVPEDPGAARLEVRAACGRDVQVQGEMPSHVQCMGWNEDMLAQRLTPSEGFHPSCQLLLTVRRPGGGGYRLSEWAPCERPQDLENLLARVLAQFLEDWRGAGASAPPP